MNKFPSVKNYLVSQKFLLLIFFHASTSFTPVNQTLKEEKLGTFIIISFL